MPTKPRATVLVSGKVTDRLGRPISDVGVDFYPGTRSLGAFYRPQRVATDSSGSYSVELVAGVWDLFIIPPTNVGYREFAVDTRITVSPNESRFDFVFDGFRIDGRVIAPTGAALDNVHVFAVGRDYVSAGTTTQSGVFSLLLPTGSYHVSVTPGFYSGFPPRNVSGVSVQADTTFDILLGGNLVTGTVHGPGGAPLESVLVTASGASEAVRGRTALDGTYALYAHAGDYRFLCEPAGSNSYILARISTLRTITGPATFDFDLSGVEWTGTVRSSATHLPIEGVRVNAALFADAYYRSARTTADAAGQFRLVLEPSREYSLRLTSPVTAEFAYPGIFATADTTFDILLDPTPVP